MSIDKTQKNVEKYACVICDFITGNKFDYSRHIKTTKHILRVSAMQHDIKSNTCDKKTHNHICSVCNAEYKDPSGLWRHKKKCSEVNHQNEFQSSHVNPPSHASSEDMQMTLILELVKQNQEFKDMLLQQSNQMMEQNKTMI